MNARKVVIYQLVVRYFSNQNSANRFAGTLEENGSGKFADINELAVQALKDLGVTHVWLTGCLRQATLTDYSALGLPADDPDTVKGRAGSFYAVRDYFDVSPDYALEPANRLAEFEALVARLHAAQLKVLIDLVPNHVARSYHSVIRPDLDFGAGDDTTRFFARDNSFFYLVDPPGRRTVITRPRSWNPPGVVFDGLVPTEDGAPGRPPKATGDNMTSPEVGPDRWYETVKLNYGFNFDNLATEYEPRPRTWTLMNEVIAYWQGKGVDGFRCDFSHFVPAEFWRYLLTEARLRNPDAYFVAEAYPWEGSRDPIQRMNQLIDAGFDSVYDDAAYNLLKRIYLSSARQEDYDQTILDSPVERPRLLQYLENHDERRIASPLVYDPDAHHSGFGSAAAGYQLAPLQYLQSRGPINFYNGQEVGETGAGLKGYNQDDGRTTLFDYWHMPELGRWVNGHRYDGGQSTEEERALRNFYRDLLHLCQDESALAEGRWGLKYYNRPERFADCPADLFSFARYGAGSGRMMVVAANFRGGASIEGRLRLPNELIAAAGLPARVRVRIVLRRAACDELVAELDSAALATEGFGFAIPVQSSAVYIVS
ncbi:MAG TPA: alpha-amylase family glycosyl hydrolase [Roseiarcus sp.]|jgi:glycosidase|nr:alpha-amylase family glycosyl hydrolase [Roseiarcus sp.]